MDNEIDVPEVIETPEAVTTPEVETPPEKPAVPETDERDQKIADLEDKNRKLFARAKAAEDARRAPATPDGSLSATDTIILSAAIAKGDVDADDIERVQKFAISEDMSIKDALKSDELKAIIAVRRENRTTAQAANVSNVRRGPTKIADDVLVANADKGRLPESDDDIERLVAAKARQSR